MRKDGRLPDQLREVRFQRDFVTSAPGSVLVSAGDTVVLCSVSIEDGIPPFLMNTNKGWLTAEYSMLPGSTPNRKVRDGRRGKVDGRSLEIGRLIGRALRATLDLTRFPGRTFWVDCDVLQADGGTRTWSISGATVALHLAFEHAQQRGWLRGWPIRSPVAALSVGIVEDQALADLNYHEDSRAEVDLNVVMTGEGDFVEVQGAAEKKPFSRARMDELLAMAESSMRNIFTTQEQSLQDGS